MLKIKDKGGRWKTIVSSILNVTDPELEFAWTSGTTREKVDRACASTRSTAHLTSYGIRC